jgi:hypothetical protein
MAELGIFVELNKGVNQEKCFQVLGERFRGNYFFFTMNEKKELFTTTPKSDPIRFRLFDVYQTKPERVPVNLVLGIKNDSLEDLCIAYLSAVENRFSRKQRIGNIAQEVDSDFRLIYCELLDRGISKN